MSDDGKRSVVDFRKLVLLLIIIGAAAGVISYVVSMFRPSGKYGVLYALKEKYGESFVIVGADEGFYKVSPKRNLSVEFYAKADKKYEAVDNYKAAVWSTDGAKIFSEYDIQCNITEDDINDFPEHSLLNDSSNDLYDGVSTYSYSEKQYCYVINAESDDPSRCAAEIFELYSRIGDLRPFCTLEQVDHESSSGVGSSSYYIPVLVIKDDKSAQTRFSVNKAYTEADIYSDIVNTIVEISR